LATVVEIGLQRDLIPDMSASGCLTPDCTVMPLGPRSRRAIGYYRQERQATRAQQTPRSTGYWSWV